MPAGSACGSGTIAGAMTAAWLDLFGRKAASLDRWAAEPAAPR